MSKSYNFRIVAAYIEYKKGVFCQCCYRENMKIVYVVKDVFNVTKEVGRNCAKRLTGQVFLIEELYGEMRSLDGKRKRFCSHRSSKSWLVPVKWDYANKVTLSLWRWEINYFGYRVRVSETKGGDHILKVNCNIIKNENINKPLYFKTSQEAKLYFFDRVSEYRINTILHKYGTTN